MKLIDAYSAAELMLLLISAARIVQSNERVVVERAISAEPAQTPEIILEGPELTCGLTTYDLVDESGAEVFRAHSDTTDLEDYSGDDDGEDCDKDDPPVQPRVINGNITAPGQFPFIATFGLSGGCGGVIIDEYHILTAAHCISAPCPYGNEANDRPIMKPGRVWVGVHHQGFARNPMDEASRTKVEVEKAVYPKEFDNCTKPEDISSYDIALLRTKTKMHFKLTKQGYGSVNKICMPANKGVSYKTGDMVTLAGWGVAEFGGPGMNNQDLRHVELPVFDSKSCVEVFDAAEKKYKFKHATILASHQVCAGYSNGTKGGCYGDSGSPSMRRVGNNSWELVGITSFGSLYCNSLSVFTRVAHFLDWIKANW